MGSDIDKTRRSGLRVAVGALPKLTVNAQRDHLSLSACMLVASATSADFGSNTMRVAMVLTSILAVVMSGK